MYESIHDHKHAHICVCTCMSAQTHACMHIYMCACMNVTVHVHMHACVLQCIQALACSKCLRVGCLSLATARPSGSAWQSPHPGYTPEIIIMELSLWSRFQMRSQVIALGAKMQAVFMLWHLAEPHPPQPLQSPRRQIWTVWLQNWSSENGTKCMSLPLVCWKTLY